MSVLASTLILIALAATAILAAMAMLGTNPFASFKTFAICAIIALVVGAAVVGGFSLTHGPPQITRA